MEGRMSGWVDWWNDGVMKKQKGSQVGQYFSHFQTHEY